MLIRFIVENFTSFADQSEISMIAGRQEIHPKHLIAGYDNDFKILRTAVIYGPNASGKSNLIKAMAFAKNLIIKGTSPKARIPVKPFLLDASLKKSPSFFQFSFCHKGVCYTYSFKADTETIREESLAKIINGNETPLFERTTDAEGNAKIVFAHAFEKSAEEKNFLTLVARGTRANQLFLAESMQRNVKHFEDAWQWFAQKLIIIFPETRALGIEFAFEKKNRIAPLFMNMLKAFDTGIVDIDAQEIPIESTIDIPQPIKEDFQRMISDQKTNIFITGPSNIRYVIRRNEKEELVALKLKARHYVNGSTEQAMFDFSEESDGTQRIVDLLPAMAGLLGEDKVVVVDEIDRSLHPHVTYGLFDMFLREAVQFKSQLIATTHATNLFTFKLLRKDEIWLVEKDNQGMSKIFSLEEFNPRYDKDIMTGYMNGRFGAVPSILNIPNPVDMVNSESSND